MTNKKSTKRALAASVLSLLLCCTMLLGTTFAWFTDSASTGVNTIQSGNLDMEVYHQVNGEWVAIDGATNLFSNVNGEPILWEPGVTATETFKIVNEGNLALKYVFYLTYANATETADGKTLADVLTCGLTGYVPTTPITSLEDIVADGILEPGQADELPAYIMWEPTDHDDDYNVDGGLSIELGVKVFATQFTFENDATGNQYDKDATLPSLWDGKTFTAPTQDASGIYHITNAAEFAEYISSFSNLSAPSYRSEYHNAKVVLDCDIDFNGNTIERNSVGYFYGQFDGQNHTISNFKMKGNADSFTSLFGAFDSANACVKNLVIRNANVTGGPQTAVIATVYSGTIENCRVYDNTIMGEKKVGAVAAYVQENGTIKNNFAENCTIYCSDDRTEDVQATVYGYNNGGTFDNAEPVNCTVKTNVQFVSNATDLYAVLENPLNPGNQPARNVVLLADIDGSAWTPVDGNTNYGELLLDGNGHTIKNLSACLFDNLPARNFVFKNLTFTNVNITDNDESGLGVLVGQANGDGGGSYTVTNCHINGGTIAKDADNDTDGRYIGGFIGFLSGSGVTITFTDCSVTNVTISSYKSAGSFVGHTYGFVTFENCSVNGNTSVTTTENRNSDAAKAGVLAGTVYGAAVKNCTIAETVTISNTNAQAPINGGLFGRNMSSNVAVTVE